MKSDLSLLIYTKNADVACLVFKSEHDFFRENNLFNYWALADSLEDLCSQIRAGELVNDSLYFSDKRGNQCQLVCAIYKTGASLTVLKSKMLSWNPVFNWKGPVANFLQAVQRMLQKLSKRG